MDTCVAENAFRAPKSGALSVVCVYVYIHVGLFAWMCGWLNIFCHALVRYRRGIRPHRWFFFCCECVRGSCVLYGHTYVYTIYIYTHTPHGSNGNWIRHTRATRVLQRKCGSSRVARWNMDTNLPEQIPPAPASHAIHPRTG